MSSPLRHRHPATLALAAWTLLVWTTRIRNILGDDALSTGEQLRSSALALSFTVLALAAAHGAWHGTAWRSRVTQVFAAWTVGVWLVRGTGIAFGDHTAAFIAVHLVLAAVSIALSAVAWRDAVSPQIEASAPGPRGSR